MVVDGKYHHVFVSGGPTANGVVILNVAGNVEETIGGQYGATGMVLSGDGKKLWVALAAGDAISEIDPRTHREVARYSTGVRTCPTHLARTGEVLWFSHGCDGTWSGGIGRVVFPPPPGAVPDARVPSA